MRRKRHLFVETYVVRVYRRNPSRPGQIVGIVEQVGMEGGRRFHNLEELNVILTAQGRDHQKDGGEKTGSPHS
jgi:hypothetical protein